MTCEQVRAQLEMLVDGELDADREREIRTHLASCDACRSELARLEKLEQLLRDSLEDCPVDPETLLARIDAQLRARRLRTLGLGLAAAALLALGAWFVLARQRQTPIDPRLRVQALLDEYLREAGARREKIADEIASFGPSGVPVVVARLRASDPRAQVELAKILQRYKDEQVRVILLEYAHEQEPPDEEEVILPTLGTEREDAELVPQLLRMAVESKADAFVKKALRDLNRSGINREADEKIRASVIEWLKSDNRELVRRGLEIADYLGLRFTREEIEQLLEAREESVRKAARAFLRK